MPETLTDILAKQLTAFQADTNVEHVGTVLEVGDGIARISGLRDVQSNEMVRFENGTMGVGVIGAR
jgi:F-type H+-transporting ATPase subunit alpha